MENKSTSIIGNIDYGFYNIRSINASPINKLIIIIGQNNEIEIQDYNNNKLKIIKKIT